jgi:hypothetical protein
MDTTTNLSNFAMKMLKETISYSESHLGYIFSMNLDFVIAGAEIDLGEHLGSR